jgi:hypothetical protein
VELWWGVQGAVNSLEAQHAHTIPSSALRHHRGTFSDCSSTGCGNQAQLKQVRHELDSIK